MGKHEVGTPKYIANKIKAKGLQKLRWFCQMCEKQCRDENGFKCHTMSESHHRQLLLFADNQHKYMDEFSREFSQGYINLLKRQFGTRRTPANRVYQEYIADRGHVHMNATIWLSLTAFVKWLGRSGKCVVDETEKGWFVTYVDRDPETLALQEKKAKKQKMDKDDQERMMDFIEKQVEKGRQETFDPTGEFKVPLTRAQDDAPLVFELKSKPKPMAAISSGLSQKSSSSTKKIIKTEPLSDAEGDAEDSPKGSTLNFDESFSRMKRESSQKRYNNDEESSYSGKRRKSKKNDSDEERKAAGKEKRGWLWEGLTVKIITDSLGDKYYKAKGQIVEIAENGFVAKLKIKNPESVEGHCLRLDQAHLETVLPAIGKQVLIVQGKYTGLRAVLRKVRIDEFAVDVELCDDDKIVKRLSYESVCKYEKMR